jgi:isopenicillin-N epimerase
MPSPLAKHWHFPPDLIFLNHGSFGATPRRASEARMRLLARIEDNPMRFFLRDLEALADTARAFVAGLVHARRDDIAWVSNATEGIGTVLRSLPFAPGDEIVVTSHGYNACNQAALYVAERTGAHVVVADVPFPIAHPGEVTEAIAAVLSDKTKLVLVDHITSPTALVFPIADIVALCEQRGIETLVDGAHAPGQTPVDLTALGASYYVANCHKWLCAPKAIGFLHVRPDKQKKIRPLAISHGANSPRNDRSKFRLEFDWTGTADPTPMLCVEESVSALMDLAGSLDALIDRNHVLALQMRDSLCAKLGLNATCPDAMSGSMVTLPLSPGKPGEVASIIQISPLQLTLAESHRIEVPVFHFPRAPQRWIRLSAQLYNDLADAEHLGDCLLKLL